MAAPEPGWYGNPDGAGERWWDGQTWTTKTRRSGWSGRWDSRPKMIEGLPSGTIRSRLESIRDTGPQRIERGSSRWVAGLAVVATGVVLILSAFLEWGATTSYGYRISMSGLGQVTVKAPTSEGLSGRFVASSVKSNVEDVVQNPGIWAILVGLTAAVAGAAYLWAQWRSQAALIAAIGGGIEFLVCAGNLMSMGAMMGNSGSGSYSIGFGLLLACGSTLVLVGVGITAFVLERIAIGSRSDE